MKLIAIIIAMLLIVPVYGQRSKKKDEVTEEVVYTEGIIYALPRTGIRISVKATEEVYTPGPYAAYANDLLGIKDVSTRPSTRWVIDDIKLDFFSEPDPENIYKSSGVPASLISLTPDGCIAGVGLTDYNPPGNLIKTSRVSYPYSEEGFQFTNLSDTPLFAPGDSTNGFTPTKISVGQKAAQAAALIFKCRTSRFETAVGFLDELPPDGEAYKQSLNELSAIEKTYVSLFVGRKSSKSYTYGFDFIPASESVKGEVVFRFSEQKGVLEKSDLSGKPVMLNIEKLDVLAGKQNKMSASDNPYAGDSGIYYRMPGMAGIKVIYELKTIATARTPVAQFGAVAPVPEEFLNGNYQLEFYPGTGSIKKIIRKQ